MKKETHTIAAIATPRGKGGISIIKISGDKAFSILKKITKSKKITQGGRSCKRQAIYTPIFDKNEKIDNAILLTFVAPYSYTGENVVEIQCHGGEIITERILRIILNNGARLAENGEFTKRAVLNNKMTLKQAESLNDFINAKTEAEAKRHLSFANGEDEKKIKKIVEEIEQVLGKMIVFFDYPEDEEIAEQEIFKDIEKIEKKIKSIIDQEKQRLLSKRGIKVAIIGEPNVGKSTILNLLLSTNRAIVSEIKGTTRDNLSEEIEIENKRIEIIDTAGIRQGRGRIEKEGIKRSKKIIKEADIVLFVVDLSKKNKEKVEIQRILRNKYYIFVGNKKDAEVENEYNKKIRVKISAKNKRYRQVLNKEIIDKIKEFEQQFDIKSNYNLRQNSLIKEAVTIISASKGENMEITFSSLKIASEKLKESIGEQPTEEMFNKIFSAFCLGK